MRAIGFGATRIKIECVFLDFKAALAGDGILAFLDFRVVEFLDPAAINADQMIVMLAAVDFEHGLARFEKMAFQQPCLFELREYAINGRQSDIHVFGNQHPVNVFRRHVALRCFLEQFKDLQAREGGLEPHVLEALWIAHREMSGKGWWRGRNGISGMI